MGDLYEQRMESRMQQEAARSYDVGMEGLPKVTYTMEESTP